MLTDRLSKYKTIMGYEDETNNDAAASKKRQRTASEEERRKQQYASHEAETRNMK